MWPGSTSYHAKSNNFNTVIDLSHYGNPIDVSASEVAIKLCSWIYYVQNNVSKPILQVKFEVVRGQLLLVAIYIY